MQFFKLFINYWILFIKVIVVKTFVFGKNGKRKRKEKSRTRLLKKLKWRFYGKFQGNTRRRHVKAILYVSGDGLRVVEDETKGLIVDQTIEKVSFCAPDRNHEKGFSYICRDGTTRRWMCHGFLALKESVRNLMEFVSVVAVVLFRWTLLVIFFFIKLFYREND